jgi:hypothetical protein
MSTVLEASERNAVEHDRTAFNLAVWDKIVANPEFAAMPYRFETDEHGQIILSPPPAPTHGNKQSKICSLLWRFFPGGEVISECPISTRKGVKAADVAWCSPDFAFLRVLSRLKPDFLALFDVPFLKLQTA